MWVYSGVYDFLWDNSLADRVAEAVGAELGSNRTVLDVGAGTGIITQRLASMGHDVVATEPNASMRRQFGKRLPNTPCQSLGIDHVDTDSSLARSADVVIAVNVVHMTDDPSGSVEHLECVAQGKTLIIVTPHENMSLLRVVKALLANGIRVRRVLAFVGVHLALAPLTLVTSSGIPRKQLRIESDRCHTVANVSYLHVWSADGTPEMEGS